MMLRSLPSKLSMSGGLLKPRAARRRLFQSARSWSAGIWVSELDLSRAPTLDAGGPVGALELSPEFEVERGSALVERAIEPGVSSELAGDAVSARPPSYTAPSAHLVRLEPGFVETGGCVAFNPDFGFVGETLRRAPRKMEKRGYVFDASGRLMIPDRTVVSVEFPAVLLAAPFGPSYFHWLFDPVARFLVARELVPDDARFLVKGGMSTFQLDALAVAGVAGPSIFELPPDRVVEFPVLYAPPGAVSRGSWVRPLGVGALRTLAPERTAVQRLYVSRASAGVRRRIVNEDEVIATVERHGFTPVAAEALSVREQIELFSEAEAVLGGHGAGLTNVVFSPRRATLFELQPLGYGRGRAELYWNIAAICNLDYVQIVCRATERGNYADFCVDCSHLDRVLRHRLPRHRDPRD
jgi:Glycosyltransferase 61